MSNSQKLSVKHIPPANSNQPLVGRKYTLTHSDITGDLFLDVGYIYNFESIDPIMRDEVLAEWQIDSKGRMNLIGKAYVDGGEFSEDVSGFRFNIFQKEMSTALKGMINGDRAFFLNYPHLLSAPIYIYFESTFPQYRQISYYGTPRHYLNFSQI